jgi:acyl carrier protein
MSIKDEALGILKAKAAQIYKRDKDTLGEATSFKDDLEATSVDFVQLSAALEDEFEIEIPFMEFRQKETFGEAAAWVAGMLGE